MEGHSTAGSPGALVLASTSPSCESELSDVEGSFRMTGGIATRSVEVLRTAHHPVEFRMTVGMLRPLVLAVLAVGLIIGGCILQLAGSSGPETAGALLVLGGLALGFRSTMEATAAKKSAARRAS